METGEGLYEAEKTVGSNDSSLDCRDLRPYVSPYQ